MKGLVLLPALATAANILVAFIILQRSSNTARAEGIPSQHEISSLVEKHLAAAATVNSNECESSDLERHACAQSDAPALPLPDSTSFDLFDDDPNMKRMPSFPDFKAYVRPDISTFYQEEASARKEVKPSFSGQAGKFINMSPEKLHLYWEPGYGRPGVFQGTVGPFRSRGTGTFPSHQFSFRSASNPDDVKCRFTVVPETSIYFYDPFKTYDGDDAIGWCAPITGELRNTEDMSPGEWAMYSKNMENNEFAKRYKDFAGAEWISMYPRSRPRNDMWRADYFGQQHSVLTRETQFHQLPPQDKHGMISRRSLPGNETYEHQLYRDTSDTSNLTLTAVSCAPRAFEIKLDGHNFLSDAEVDHLLSLAKANNLARSMVGQEGHGGSTDSTRTSFNTWLYRESSPILDVIYRRVADALRLDEALLRTRNVGERPDLDGRGSLAEAIQLVHYDVGQEYTAHHDFGYPTNINGDHASRWANVLMYLNNVEEGGETSFPRWRNADTSDPMNVKPEKGKAVLFYMLLPDGNLDDLTQHAALPVLKGEKWLANLWIWDPTRD